MDPAMTLAAAGQAWLRWANSTVKVCARRNQGVSYRRWCRIIGADVALGQITPDVLAQYQAYVRDNLKHSTATLDQFYLVSFLRWATGQNPQLEPMHWERAVKRVPTGPRKGIRILYPDEEARLLKACPQPWVRAAIIVALETGLRGSTLMSLEWTQIGKDGWLRLRGDQLKSGREMEVPLSPRAREALERVRDKHLWNWPKDKPGTKVGRKRKWIFWRHLRTLKWYWWQAVQAAGIPPLRFHDLRSTFLTRCRQRGVPMEVAMELSDHHCLTTVLRCYRYVDRMELLKAVGRGGENGTKLEPTEP